jgi:mevalonate kinase
MKQFSFKDSMILKIKSTGLTEQQKRLIRSVNTLIVELLETEKEDEFFEHTEEVVRLVAALVKQSNFPAFVKGDGEILYAEQALESSFEKVQEKLYTEEINVYDN